MVESLFQAKLITRIEEEIPGSIILKNDPGYLQGIPDLLVLYNNRWAALECKEHATASRQPNQKYYIDLMNKMSYASFVYPENVDEVMDGLQEALRI